MRQAIRWDWIVGVIVGTGTLAGLPQATSAEPKPSAESVPVLTLGTPKNKVDTVLGPVRSTWTINCLHREMVTYTDGSKAIFVNNLLISANPSGMTLDALSRGYVMERQNRQIIFEPCVLCGADPAGPMAETKRQVEESFWMAPPSHVPPPPYASFVPAFEPAAPLFPRFHLRCGHTVLTGP
jgi:hypothetical protein